MNKRLLALTFGFVAAATLGCVPLTQALAETAPKDETAAKSQTGKPEAGDTHKEHGKHAKSHHEKHDGAESGEAKEAK